MAVVLLALLAGCTSAPDARRPGSVRSVRSPAPRRAARRSTAGGCDLRQGSADARRRLLANAGVCVRDALLDGQPARFVRVSGSGAAVLRTTYVVTGRGELAISQTSGSQTRLRRCTHATGLDRLGTCTRVPGSGM